MKRLSEYLFLGTLGGALYYTFEMLFRGFSHLSMFLLGGICLQFFAQQGLWTDWEEPLWKQVGWCVVFVTACEFITGLSSINSWAGRYGTIQIPSPFSHGADLPAVYGHIFRAVRIRDPAERVSAPFPVREKMPRFHVL